MLAAAHKKVSTVSKQFRRGLILVEVRQVRVIQIWNDAKEVIQQKLVYS